eukprot:147584_1
MVVTRFALMRDWEIEHIKLEELLDETAQKLKESASVLGVFTADGRCDQEVKAVFTADGRFTAERTVHFKGAKLYDRIKNFRKKIKDAKITIRKQLDILKEKMNEATWRKHGRLKSKKTLHERAVSYKKDKEARAAKYDKQKKKKSKKKSHEDVDDSGNKQSSLKQYFKQKTVLAGKKRTYDEAEQSIGGNKNKRRRLDDKQEMEGDEDNDIDVC